jgi:hypothetical protein
MLVLLRDIGVSILHLLLAYVIVVDLLLPVLGMVRDWWRPRRDRLGR